MYNAKLVYCRTLEPLRVSYSLARCLSALAAGQIVHYTLGLRGCLGFERGVRLTVRARIRCRQQRQRTSKPIPGSVSQSRLLSWHRFNRPEPTAHAPSFKNMRPRLNTSNPHALNLNRKMNIKPSPFWSLAPFFDSRKDLEAPPEVKEEAPPPPPEAEGSGGVSLGCCKPI